MRPFLAITTLFFTLNAFSQSWMPLQFPIRQYSANDAILFTPSNPASLAGATAFTVVVNAETAFMLMPDVLVSAIVPAGSSSFHAGAGYRGTSLHSDAGCRLAYARKLAENVAAGIGFDYSQTNVPGYVRWGSTGISGGILIRISKGLVTGMDIRKQIGLGPVEKFPSDKYRAGLGYAVSEFLLVAAEAEKEDGQAATFSSAIEYRFHKDLFVSVGVITGTGAWFFGSGITISSYTAEARFLKHPLLGWSPSITIAFQKKNKNNEKTP